MTSIYRASRLAFILLLPLLPSAVSAEAFPGAAAKAKCEAEWGNDYSMQAYCLSEQRKGFGQVLEMKSNLMPELIGAVEQCERDWTDDFVMQAYCISEQIKAKKSLEQNWDGPPADVVSEIKRKCEADWLDDYVMQAYCTTEQVKAWRTLQ
ncbi:hypothetical protein T8A63_15155 [Sulfitobacter sp. OXR-159]|uniref:hypothetical protein n=1 Tax=Sulfitobacter sp. OXR-159 TaxID=3100174 RepID=UPI002AC9E3B7|nr:hypothetical protein [Sulfitobacter sp. OXR-159]WPZ28953.1 hypothetical protein T8A63_15155 [Sulfitobacter sp. OXR-159]